MSLLGKNWLAFRRVGGRILAPALILVLFGLVVLFSIAPFLLGQQALFCFFGLILFFLLWQTDYRVFKIFGRYFYLAVIVLLASLFIFAPSVRGTVRWFELGNLQIQPSELVKPFLIIFFASVLSSLGELSLKNLFFLALSLGLPVVLVVRQPDLGTAFIFLFFWLGMVLVRGFPLKIFIVFFLLLSFLLPQLWNFLKEYQQLRILTFFDPHLDPLGAGYNVIQAQIAIGSGQILGKGLGFGTQSHLKFLPEQHSDFVFASLAEEAGFLGSVLLLAVFFLLIAQILIVAKEAGDSFGCLLAVGVGSQLLVQVFVNLGMNLGLLPITGITLPLVSYGGSSLVSTFISLGLVASVAKRNKPAAAIDIR